MPLQQHITARHAMWAIRLIKSAGKEPWVHVARTILFPSGQVHLMNLALGIAHCDVQQCRGPEGSPLPPPLLRLALALAAMPAWRDARREPGQLRKWVPSAPLWGNPLAVATAGALRPRRGLEAEFPVLAAVHSLRTVWDLREALVAACSVDSQAAYRAEVWATYLGGHPQLGERRAALHLMQGLANRLPREWRLLVFSDPGITAEQLAETDTLQAVSNNITRGLGWDMPRGRPLQLQHATVRACTALLRGAQPGGMLGLKLESFIELAGQGMEEEGGIPTVPEALASLRRLWSVPWDNSRKELYWRLVLDGLPNAQRMGGLHEACQCGCVAPGRRHHYWECPPAAAVVAALQQQVAQGAHVELQCPHVWLARSPHPAIKARVWRVVALAALHGMDRARKLLYRWRKAAEEQQHQQQQQQQQRVVARRPGARQQAQAAHPPPPMGQQVTVACRVAVAAMWDMLHDFAALRKYPPDWLVGMQHHPFLSAPPGAEVLQVHRR
jgi:hypothetical protein